MDPLYLYQQYPGWLIILFGVVALWDTIWKLIALWRSAGNKDLVWFIFIALFNTAGILPIFYLLTHKEKIYGKSCN